MPFIKKVKVKKKHSCTPPKSYYEFSRKQKYAEGTIFQCRKCHKLWYIDKLGYWNEG